MFPMHMQKESTVPGHEQLVTQDPQPGAFSQGAGDPLEYRLPSWELSNVKNKLARNAGTSLDQGLRCWFR